MTKLFSILTKDAAAQAEAGFYVVKNTSIAHVDITDEGAQVKAGETVAISELDATAEKAVSRGLVRVLAQPSNSDAGKKNRKKTDDAPVVVLESAHPVNEAKTVTSPAVKQTESEPTNTNSLHDSGSDGILNL